VEVATGIRLEIDGGRVELPHALRTDLVAGKPIGADLLDMLSEL
jgi:hypothetical protein